MEDLKLRRAARWRQELGKRTLRDPGSRVLEAKRGLKSESVFADKRDVDISAIAVQGLDQAQVQLQAAATRLVSAGAPVGGSNLDTVDLSAGMVALMSAKNYFSVNITVLKTADEIQKTVLDLMA